MRRKLSYKSVSHVGCSRIGNLAHDIFFLPSLIHDILTPTSKTKRKVYRKNKCFYGVHEVYALLSTF
jgi:hypothetical protein